MHVTSNLLKLENTIYRNVKIVYITYFDIAIFSLLFKVRKVRTSQTKCKKLFAAYWNLKSCQLLEFVKRFLRKPRM